MSIRLRDLIKAVRSCKTAAQERDVIAKEAAALRAAFRDDVASGVGVGGDGTIGGSVGTGVGALFRHRNVAKLMYMHMLGYPSHFGQMEALKLVASPGFAGKRIGYLALAVLLDERQEVLMLVTNSLKNDLNSTDQYVVGLALAALAGVASRGMAVDLAPEVARLCCHPSAYVRKKAAATAVRLLSKAPEDVVASFVDAPVALVGDRHHGVVLAGCSLARAVASTASVVGVSTGDDELKGVAASYARELPPTICRALRGLLAAGGGATEHDSAGVCDPFLQVALLRLLRALWELAGESVRPGDADAAADVVAAVAASTDAGLPPVVATEGGGSDETSGGKSRRHHHEQQQAPGMGGGSAVLYEAAKTALALAGVGSGGGGAKKTTGGTGSFGDAGSISGSKPAAPPSSSKFSAAATAASRLADGGASLRVLAVGILGRFLSCRDHNLRYVSLDALSRVASREPAAVQRHRSTVVACVRDGDAATRRAALELVCCLATRGNAAALARELTDYLPLADKGFRPVLAARICAMARRHAGADNKRWLVDVTLRVLAALGGGGKGKSSKSGDGGKKGGFGGGAAAFSHIDESVPRSLVVTITNAPELHAYAARALYRVLSSAVEGGGVATATASVEDKDGNDGDANAPSSSALTSLPPPALLRVAVWIVGEYSDLLIAQPPPGVLEGEEGIEGFTIKQVTADDVAATLERVLAASSASLDSVGGGGGGGFAPPVAPVDVRAAVLTALAKLAARGSATAAAAAAGSDSPLVSRVVGDESSLSRSADVEVQTRACEYSALLRNLQAASPSKSNLACAVLERLPPLDEAAHDALLDVEPLTEEEVAAAAAARSGVGGASATAAAASADSLLGDLMSLDVPVASISTSSSASVPAAAAAAAAGADALADIFGSVDLLSPATATTATTAATPTASAAAGPSPPSKATPLPEDLFAAPPAAVVEEKKEEERPKGEPSSSSLWSTTAIEDASGLSLSLAFSKPDSSSSPEETIVVATARKHPGAASGDVTGFALQAAVPKYIRLRLDPASGTTLGGNDDNSLVTQTLHLSNTSHGAKPLALRLRVTWKPPGGEGTEPRTEMVEVKGIPAEL